MGTPIIGADSRLDQDTLTTSVAAAIGFPIVNLTDDRTFTLYKMATNNTQLDIITDAGSGNTEDVGYFMLVGHNLGTLAANPPQTVTITFAESADNISYTTIFTTTIAADVNTIVARAFTDVTNRFFRLRISWTNADKVQMGQLAWGKPVRFPFGMEVNFDPNDEQLNARFNQAQLGNLLGATVLFSSRRARVALQHQPSSFVDDATLGGFREFWDNTGAKMKRFMWMWNSSTTFEKDTFFAVVVPGRINRSLVTQLDTGFRDLEFEVVGLKEV